MAVLLNTTIHDLSPEILSSIFLIATHHFEDRFESILLPITISHVSSRWREVAISTRGLWTSINLTFSIVCLGQHSQYSRSMTWLSRSYPYPIDIYIDFRDPSWDWDEDSHWQRFHLQHMEHMKHIAGLLLPHVKRWCHVELLSDTWFPVYLFLWHTRHVEAAPLLRSISLSRCNEFLACKGEVFQPDQMKDPIPLFGGILLDALRDVSLVGVHVDWTRSSLRNLTSLEFKYHARDVMPSLDQFLDILSGCLELRHLSIIGWGPRFEKLVTAGNTHEIWDPIMTEAPRRIILLQHLVEFSFGFVEVDYAVKVLSLFEFPSLQNLKLEDVSFYLDPMEYQDATLILDWLTPRNEQSADAPRYSTAIPRTVCSIPLNGILSLQLYGIYASDAAFSHFFSAFPSLQKLGLFDVADLTVQTLQPSSDPCIHHPCPNLRELECRNVDRNIALDVSVTRAMIDSIVSLTSINLHYSDGSATIYYADHFIELNDVGA